MENIITKILEIDQEACKRLDEAQAKAKGILAEAKADELNLKETNILRADQRIGMLDFMEKQNADEKITVYVDEREKNIVKLNKTYEEKHLLWEQEILDRIVGE